MKNVSLSSISEYHCLLCTAFNVFHQCKRHHDYQLSHNYMGNEESKCNAKLLSMHTYSRHQLKLFKVNKSHCDLTQCLNWFVLTWSSNKLYFYGSRYQRFLYVYYKRYFYVDVLCKQPCQSFYILFYSTRLQKWILVIPQVQAIFQTG